MSKYSSKRNIFTGIIFIVCFILIASLTVKVFKSNNDSDTKRLGVYSYKVGAIDSYGNEEDSNSFFRSDFIEAVTIDSIELKKKSCLEYKIYYYDDEKFFLAATDYMAAYLSDIPETVIVQFGSDK